MKYAVDKIVNDIVTLEELKEGKIINVSISKLPSNIKESDIINFDGKNYIIDDYEKRTRKEIIQEKFEKLIKK